MAFRAARVVTKDSRFNPRRTPPPNSFPFCHKLYFRAHVVHRPLYGRDLLSLAVMLCNSRCILWGVEHSTTVAIPRTSVTQIAPVLLTQYQSCLCCPLSLLQLQMPALWLMIIPSIK